MKSNLFGKLSAGVAGVAGVTLVAIGVGSTPVQAATIAVSFESKTSSSGLFPAPGTFVGQFLWQDEEWGTGTAKDISMWSFLVGVGNNKFVSAITDSVTDSFNKNSTLTVKLKSNEVEKALFPDLPNPGISVLSFTFDNLKYDRYHPVFNGQTAKGYVSTKKPDNSEEKLNFDYTYSQVVPEPSTYVGTILAFGVLGAVKVLKRKQKKQETFIP
ncbi:MULTISPECIES: PEP-CTERM sorting domain-containing protein [unclassified Microcoleus]|uniref:PEP-CTERM sorting domain-containing protein n=1 Tax=unclassified Microcoleus TaxID=2642155 RepID=UPI0025D9D1F6|nr:MULTISPECIES: PEP-CTERM sorting domain-containing protein [unclassified Microcoleus]